MKSVIRPHGIVSLRVLKVKSEKETLKMVFKHKKNLRGCCKTIRKCLWLACLKFLKQLFDCTPFSYFNLAVTTIVIDRMLNSYCFNRTKSVSV